MVQAIKSLGQNFLTDVSVAQLMVRSLDISAEDQILEIGPGLGVLTKEVVAIAPEETKLDAVEIDARLIDLLKAKFPRVEVHFRNVLDLLPEFTVTRPLKILGSLPYYITSPILHAIIKMPEQPTGCTLLIQKEVAEKISAQAPDSSYLSSFVQSFYKVELLTKVDKTKFNPVPKVDGGVLKLTLKEERPISAGQIEKYEKFLHRAYLNPRKMLNKVFSPEELVKIGIEGNLRPQNISAEKWIQTFKIISQ